MIYQSRPGPQTRQHLLTLKTSDVLLAWTKRYMLTAAGKQLCKSTPEGTLTARPAFVAPWGEHTHVTTHVPNRLSRRQVTVMVEGRAGVKSLHSEVIEQIRVKAGRRSSGEERASA